MTTNTSDRAQDDVTAARVREHITAMEDVTGAQVRDYITAMQTADHQVTLSVIFGLMENAGIVQVGEVPEYATAKV